MHDQVEIDVQGDATGMPPVHDPLRRPFGHGLTWVGEAWSLFKANWGMWIAGVLVIWLITFLLGLLPALGPLLQTIVGPMIYAGIYSVASKADYGQRIEFSDFFVGFQVRSALLLRLGLLNLAGLLLVFLGTGLLVWLMFGGDQLSTFASTWASMEHGGTPNPEAMHGEARQVFLFSMLVFVALFLPYTAALWFSVPLVFFGDDIRPLQAYGMSVRACIKNILPMFLFSLVLVGLMLLVGLTFGLGLIIVLPVILISGWTGFHDIFVAPEHSRFV